MRTPDETETLQLNGLEVTIEVQAKAPEAPTIDFLSSHTTGADQVLENSTFDGKLVHDAEALKRIEAQRAILAAAGVSVDPSKQLYATATRMADVGYANQERRSREHSEKQGAHDAINDLRYAVLAESRVDRTVKSGELGQSIAVNGKITALGGLLLREQAIRGLATRLESPMLGYVLGLRDRIAEETGKGAAANGLSIQSDRRKIADILAHECSRNPNVDLQLRTREGVGDIFAVVSPGYVPADAPAVLKDVKRGLPSSAKATWAYDPVSTSWELRANVWTPTPVAEQAVGEAFEGYVSFYSKDNGTSRLRGGGGIILLACLNAGTYTADGVSVARVHRGGVLRDIGAMLRDATTSIDALCAAWGTARSETIEVPAGVPINDAIPGFWRYCLLDRESELQGILPGRTKQHAQELSAAYFAERRDPEKLVRADLAQGWTRYIQSQPSEVRREAESAIGAWMVGRPIVRCDLRKPVASAS